MPGLRFASMPRELKISVGQHSDKGRKEANQDFHGVRRPEGAAAQPEGHRGRAGRRHQQQRGQRDRQRVRRQGFPDRLLLHLGGVVGQDLGAARDRGDQFLAARRRRGAASIRYDKDKGYVCTLSAHGHQGDAPRTSSMSATRASTACVGNALEQLTNDHRVASRPSRAISAARSASIRRSRSTTGCGSRRATCSCSRPTACTSMSARASWPARSTAHAAT